MRQKKNLLSNKPATWFFYLLIFISSCTLSPKSTDKPGAENELYDGPEKAAAFEFNKTKDPATGKVPREKYLLALDQTVVSKNIVPYSISGYGSWIERGPISDAVGASNGNTRANSGIASGRIRAILVDSADATRKTVWVGGVDGGLWKTSDITASPATWTLVNDYLSNLAISDICQDPTNSNIMYFCTGEAYFNSDAVQGNGVFKSTDHGVTWNQLSSTTSYTFCTRILCDYLGNIYLGTRGNGLLRSTNGGTNWTDITPSGLSNRICDLEITSTAVAARLHVVAGIFTTQAYRYTDIASTVTSAGWTAPATSFPSFAMRAEIGVSGSVLYAAPANASYQVPTIYKSTDGGANWAATAGQPTSGWASGQGWYALTVAINPANTNECFVGGLDQYKTTDGGATWTRASFWVGTTGQYVHADQHKALWYDGGNKLLFGCDGGIHFSADKGTTIRDKNTGLRIKQFYSCAIHPSTTDYFLAGAQDNGVHQFSSAGLGTTVEVTGGDGAYVAIDQNQAQYQFGSYVYQTYRRSTNSGVNWSSVDFYTGTSGSPVDFGQFINPFVYDNTANIIYAGASAGNFFRWTTAQTTAAGSYYETAPGFPAGASQVNLTSLGTGNVFALSVSPNTANRLYLGTDQGKIIQVDNAHTITTGSAGTSISTGLPAGSISCINEGTTDQNLICSYSNYGIASVWISSNGGTTWASLDNNGVNLPDMPVRWCMFVPGDNTKAIIATETGVWLTQLINGTSTSWIASPTFPTVRTDMIQYRSSDGLLAAATHGRGLWTQALVSVLPVNNFTLRGKWQNNGSVELNWNYDGLATGSSLEVEESADGINFYKVGSLIQNSSNNYQFIHQPAQQNVYYRIKSNEPNGLQKYSNTIRLSKAGNTSKLSILSVYPNPVKNDLNLSFNIAGKGNTIYSITSLSGQTVWKKQEDLQYTGNYLRNWNMSSIPKGSYIFTITSGKEIVSMKFLKQ